MRLRNVLLGVAAVGATSAVGTAVGERRLLREMDETPSPAGWDPPKFPDSATELMVPTDDGAELLVAAAGPIEGRPVVLVHGLTSNHHDWGPVARDLVARGHRVLGVNQRGHGGSTVGHEGFSAGRQGKDLGQVLGALDLRDVILVGHSMGGIAAMSLLTLHPESGADRVGSLALVATTSQTAGPDHQAAITIGNTKLYHRVVTHERHAPAVARFIFGRTPSREMVDAVLASNARCPRSTRRGAALGLSGYDIRHLLADIVVPTIVLCGDRDLLTPLAENRRIADAIGCDLVVAEGSGHLIIWEHADLIAETVASQARRISTDART